MWVSLYANHTGSKKDVKKTMFDDVVKSIDGAVRSVAALPVSKKNNAALKKLLAVKAEYVGLQAREEVLAGIRAPKGEQ